MEVHPFLLDAVEDLQETADHAIEVLGIVSSILKDCPPSIHAPTEPGGGQLSPEDACNPSDVPTQDIKRK